MRVGVGQLLLAGGRLVGPKHLTRIDVCVLKCSAEHLGTYRRVCSDLWSCAAVIATHGVTRDGLASALLPLSVCSNTLKDGDAVHELPDYSSA